MTLEERFWAKVDRHQEGECWLWTAYRAPLGYGEIGVSGHRTARAHRVSWEIHNGPIPDGLFVLHRCDNPPCVNPAHLFLGTIADNSRDMVAKGRHAFAVHPETQARGERINTALLTAEQVVAIRARHEFGARKGDRTTAALAREYGVNRETISKIVRRKSWAHVGAAA